MEKIKINYYLLIIFIVLLVTNIYFYFFKDRNKLTLAQQALCYNFSQCADATNCDGVGTTPVTVEIKDFKVQTFLCGEVDWNKDPWLSARQDGRPNTNVTPPPTTTVTSSQTCNVTGIGEPINVIVSASSNGTSKVEVNFKNPSGSIIYKASTTFLTSLDNFQVNYSPPTGTQNIGEWTVESEVCSQNQPITCQTTSTKVKVNQYQCGIQGFDLGTCYAQFSTSNFVRLPLNQGNWCGFWLNVNNGKGCRIQH